jgi:hypothetical protein
LLLCAAPPLAVDDTYGQAKSGDTVIGTTNSILKNDSIPCGSEAKVSLVQGPSHGTIVTITNQGAFTYRPNPPGVPLDDKFVYIVECNGEMSEATVYLPAPPREWSILLALLAAGAT